MDREKLGRALGYGARHAVKTLAKAADAATTPSPTLSHSPSPIQNIRDTVQAYNTAKGDVQDTAKRTMLTPVKKFSSVLWLEVTGTFFAIISVFLGQAVWRLRTTALTTPHTADTNRFYLYFAIFALFVYFTISSFVRARRRSRR